MTEESAIYNLDAEKSLIGAFLSNNETYHKVIDILIADHFYVPLHKKVFTIIGDFVSKGLVVTPITIKSYVVQDNDNSNYEYLLNACNNAVAAIGLESYAKEVYECYLRRNILEIMHSGIKETTERDKDINANDIIENTEQQLFQLTNNNISKNRVSHIREGLNQLITQLSKLRQSGERTYGVSTGYMSLDNMLGGMQPSDLIILAARPSMGKTALAVNILLNAAKNLQTKNQSVAFFSLEMSTEQLATRMLSIISGFNSSKIRLAEFPKKEEFEQVCMAARDLNDLPIYIDDTPAISIASLRSKARRLKKQQNLGLLVVDYLQLMRGNNYAKDNNRVNEIGEISQGLKAIAKELNVPVIALSQLSRAVESREDKRPQLSDLRESGNIEQDADVVMFIYRDEYYHSRKEPGQNDPEKYREWLAEYEKVKNIADLIIAKQRNGAIGVVQLYFNSSTTTFANLAN